VLLIFTSTNTLLFVIQEAEEEVVTGVAAAEVTGKIEEEVTVTEVEVTGKIEEEVVTEAEVAGKTGVVMEVITNRLLLLQKH
jgi:hypothetical protein